MTLQQRKTNRLPEYDYSAAGAYFITMCTKDRRKILSDIVASEASTITMLYGST